jgi:hypothetical protein
MFGSRKTLLHEHFEIKGENFFFLLVSLLILLTTFTMAK